MPMVRHQTVGQDAHLETLDRFSQNPLPDGVVVLVVEDPKLLLSPGNAEAYAADPAVRRAPEAEG